MNANSEKQFWRIRMRYSPERGNNDYSARAWSTRQVGIWYGAWSAHDYNEALKANPERPQDYLNSLSDQERLGKQNAIGRNEIHTIKRFYGISTNDWVVACFNNSIHLARVVAGAPESYPSDNELNRLHPEANVKEIWKYLTITDQKSFPLSALPDFYRLIPQAGRSNVYRLQDNNRLALEFLAECANETDVSERFEKMDVSRRLDFLGPKAWESFCLGYLIIEEHFVPTGLAVGGTLKDLDIVGRHREKGYQILAQCKKNQHPVEVEQGFLAATEGLQGNARLFYCAYAGCNHHHDYIEITKKTIEDWVKTGDGEKYLNYFFGKNSFA